MSAATPVPPEARTLAGVASARADGLAAILGLARAPSEDALVVLGEVGSGKSRLLDAAHAASPLRSARIRSNPGERERGLSGFSAFCSALDDGRMADLGGRLTMGASDEDAVFALARELLVVMRGMDLTPTLVLVDDVDLMDRASRLLLGYMAGRLRGTHLRLVATATRVEPREPLAGLPTLSLPPLGDEDALALAADAAGAGADDQTLRMLAAEGEGNPLAVRHLVSAAEPEVLAGIRPLELPCHLDVRVAEVAAQRLDGLSDAHVRVLSGLACGPRVVRAALARLSHEGPLNPADVNLLADKGLVRIAGPHLSIASPLLRAYLYWRLAHAERIEAHRLLADAHEGLDSGIAAWHRSFLDEAPDGATLIAEAARDATWSVESAVRFAERGVALGAESPQAQRAVVSLVNALLDREHTGLAERYLRLTRTDRPEPETEYQRLLAHVRLSYSRLDAVPDTAVQAWYALYGDEHPSEAVRLLCLTASHHALIWQTEPAQELLGEAERLLPRADEESRAFFQRIADLTAATHGIERGGPERPQRPSTRELAAMPHDQALLVARTLSLREDYAGARHVYAVVTNLVPRPTPANVRTANLMLVDNEFRAARFFAGQRILAELVREPAPREAEPGLVALDRAAGLWAGGDGAGALALIERKLAASQNGETQMLTARLLSLRGSILLALGDFAQAERVLHLAERLARSFRNPDLLRSAVDLVEARVRLGSMRAAHETLTRLRERNRSRPSRWSTLATARAVATATPPEKSLPLFDQALGLLRPGDSPYELGRLLLAQAAHLDALGRERDARACRDQAADAFRACGALGWLRVAEEGHPDQSTSDESESPLLEGLTAEESEVVRLVRLGYTNRQIADALFVSQRTVELRLTRTYRKTGARSRLQLLAMLR